MATLFGEIERLEKDKADIKAAIEEKGVEVGDILLDGYAEKIREIKGGSDYGTLELQDGTMLTIETVGDFIKLASWKSDEWGPARPQTIAGRLVDPYEVKGYTFGKDCTYIPNNFLSGLDSLEYIHGSEVCEEIGNNFAKDTWSLTDVDPFLNVVKVGDSFGSGFPLSDEMLNMPKLEEVGQSFFMSAKGNPESEVVFPSLKHTGNYFFMYASDFNQPISFPVLERSEGGILYGCSAFNSTISINDDCTDMGTGFLNYCTSFNQPLVLPSKLTRFDYCMAYCSSFDQPLTLPAGVTKAPDSLLESATSFNSAITFEAEVLTGGVGSQFLRDCSKFNQPLDFLFDKLEGVSFSLSDFLYGCTGFNQPVNVPAGCTSIHAFLYECASFNSEITLPDTLTDYGYYFLYGCKSYNQPFKAPIPGGNLQTGFMTNCESFNQPLAVDCPASGIFMHYLRVGSNVMQNCYNFVGPVIAQTDGWSLSDKRTAWSVDRTNCPAYQQGVAMQTTIYFVNDLGSSGVNPYRNVYYQDAQ